MTFTDTTTPPKAAPLATPGPVPRTRTLLANDAWEAALTAHASLMRAFAAEDSWSGLSMREYDVLYSLAKADRPQRIGELGRLVVLSQPALSRLVDRLVERGLVGRCTDPGDGRAAQVSLTTAGRELQRIVGLSHGTAVARALTSRLTDDELVTLEALSRKLITEQP